MEGHLVRLMMTLPLLLVLSFVNSINIVNSASEWTVSTSIKANNSILPPPPWTVAEEASPAAAGAAATAAAVTSSRSTYSLASSATSSSSPLLDQLQHSISTDVPAAHATSSHALDSLVHSTHQFTNTDHLVLPEDCCDGGEILMAFRLNSSFDKHHADFIFRYFTLPLPQQDTMSPSSSPLSTTTTTVTASTSSSITTDLSLDTSGLLSLLVPLDYERVSVYKMQIFACIFHSSSLSTLHSTAMNVNPPVNDVNEYLKSLIVNTLHNSTSPASGEETADENSSPFSRMLMSPVPIKVVSQSFTLNIKNENDEAPVIKGKNSSKYHYVKKIPENIPVDTHLLTVEATDADGDVNLSYMIPLGHPSNRYFDVNPFTGEVRSKSPLDRETQAKHHIPVLVFDSDNKHMTQANILIILTDINEFIPEFIGCSNNSSIKVHSYNQLTPTTPVPFVFYSSNSGISSSSSPSSGVNFTQVIYIPENIPKGTMFHRVIAFDKDKLPTTPDDRLGFVINSHDFTSTSASSAQHVDYSNSNDETSDLSYHIIEPVDVKLPFTLNSSTGELTTHEILDRESVSQYDITIQASDTLHTAICSLTIILDDINDNIPVFEKSVYPALISVEGYSDLDIEREVLTVKALDADSNDTIYYTLNVSSISRNDASYFNINSTSGVISAYLPALIAAQKLSPSPDSSMSKSSTFTFTVYAFDSSSSLISRSGNATVHVTLTHAIEQSSPKLKQYPYVIELNGHRSDFRIGSPVGNIEFASLGSSSSIRINVDDSASSSKCSDYFNIDSKTGSVTVKRNLIYNFYECYLNIAGGSNSDDNVPMTSSLLQLFFLKGIAAKQKARKANAFTLDVDISEITPVGSQVINLIARSRMPSLKSGAHAFTIVYSSLDNEYFDLDSKSGILYLKKVLDYEILPNTINLAIVAKKPSDPFDNPIYFNLAISIVNVNDNPPKFTQNTCIANVFESASRATFVASVFALDLDTLIPSPMVDAYSSHVKYTIEDGNLDNAFLIDSSTGVIKTNSVLDREIRSTYHLKISAADSAIASSNYGQDDSSNGKFVSWCTLEINVVDIDDNVPVLPPSYELSVKEDTKVGTVITTLTANDVDTWPKITYQLANDTSDDVPFDIDLFTGKLYLINPLSTGKLLYKMYQLHVYASDSQHQISTHISIKVKKGDVFTSSPPLAQDFQFISIDPIENTCIASGGVNCQIARVSEATSSTGISINSLSSERSFRVLYKIESDTSSSFYIDSSSGIIYNNRSLKLPSNKLFALQIVAGYSRDAARFLNHLRSRSTLLVSVEKSDFVEEFSENDVNIINVDTSIDSLGSVLVSLPLTKKYSYKIINIASAGNSGNLLLSSDSSITPSDTKSNYGNFLLLRNNQLTLVDGESPGAYRVEIEGWPKKLSGGNVIKFIVNVKIVSDGKITLTPKVYHVKLPEDSPVGHDVISLTSDLEYSQPLKYIITSGNDKGDFKINDYTGLVIQESRLSYDTCNYYQLTVSVRRRADNHQLSLILLNIQVQRVIHDSAIFNSKFPSITHLTRPTSKASVKENMPIGTNVARLPEHSTNTRYTLSPTSGPVPFDLDSSTGYVVTTQVIDYETTDPPFFRLLFVPVSSKSAEEISIEIEIESVDEYPPKFYPESYYFNATVYLGNPVSRIGRVHASDRDSGPDGRVFYSLRSSSPNSALNKFIIDQSTGIISLNSLSPDDLPPNQCSLIIMASSGRERSLTALTIVTVSIRVADSSELYASNGKDGLNNAHSSTDSSVVGSGILMLVVFLLIITIILLFVMLAIRVYQSPTGESILSSNSCTFDMNTLLKKRMASNCTINSALSPLDHPSYMSHLNRSGNSNHTYMQSMHSVSSSYMLPPHSIEGAPPPCYSQITNVTTSTNMEGTSASSGRGSVDGDAIDGDDEFDQEIRMIIEGTDPYYEPPADAVLHVPASEYLAKLGVIDHPNQDIPCIAPQTMSDVIEEIDHDDVVSENLGDLSSPRSKSGFSSVRSLRIKPHGHHHHHHHHTHRPGGRRSRHHLRNYNSTHTIGSDFISSNLASLADNGNAASDELTEAYNWNYLNNWQPRYQPLTVVFAEIAKLKGTTVSTDDRTQAELMMDQEPIQEQSYLSRLETISTLSGSTTNSSCFRRYPPVASNYQLSPKSPSSEQGLNSLNVSIGSLASSNPLVQASSTSAFSPVGKTKSQDAQLNHRVDQV